MYVRDVHAKQKNMGLLENLNYVCSLEMEIRDFPTFSGQFYQFSCVMNFHECLRQARWALETIDSPCPKMAGICASLLDSQQHKADKMWKAMGQLCVCSTWKFIHQRKVCGKCAKHKHLSLKYSANFPSNIKHFSFWLKIFQIFRQCMLS